MIKRIFDVALSAIGILCLLPVFVVAAVAVKATSSGPVLFRQERIGRGFRPFYILKFRSMVADAPALGREITAGEDPRITRLGRVLRRSKIDELPQLFNVLRGDMSLVGPRPEVRRYVEMFRDDFAEILQVRPGVTDPASIEFRDEASLLGSAEDPDREYVSNILPRKIALARDYARRRSLGLDAKIIVATIARLFCDRFGQAHAGEHQVGTG